MVTVSRYRRPYRGSVVSRGRYGGLAASSRAAMQVGRAFGRWAASRSKSTSGTKRARAPSTKPAAKRKSVGYYTVGRLGKKFAKPKAVPVSKFLRDGYVEAVEAGGEVTSSECPYVGHGFGHEKILLAAVAAIVRKMLKNIGFRIASWDDVIVGTSTIVLPGGYRLVYRESVSGPFIVLTVPFAADSSWQAILNQIVFSIKTIISGKDVEAVTVDELLFYSTDSTGNEVPMARSRVFLTDVMLHFNCMSSLSLQNRTRASVDAADGDVYSSDNILNNPLGGKCYEGSGTGAQLKEESNALGITKNLAADSASGLIEMNYDEANMSAAQQKILRRPPAKTAFLHVTKTGAASLSPGQIRTSRLMYTQKLSFSVLLQKMFPILRLSAVFTDVLLPIGSFRFYGFEKRCNTRVNEGNIDLGYELNTVYRCWVSEKTRGVAVVNTIL